MDWFKWNRPIGIVLGIVFFVLIAWIVVKKPFAAPPKPAEAAAPPSAGATATAGEETPDFAIAIPAASADNGKTIADRCAVCHDWSKGGPNKIGPNLYGIVGRERASAAGFDYSPALKARGGAWSYADLFAYLKQPAAFAPGNKMAFAGLPDAKDRLDLIAFLRLQTDAPAALPTP